MCNNIGILFSSVLNEIMNKLLKKDSRNDETIKLFNQLIEIYRYVSINENKFPFTEVPEQISTQLKVYAQQFNNPEIQKLNDLNTEIYRLLLPLFCRDKTCEIPRFVVPLEMEAWKKSYQFLKKELTGCNFTLLNQPSNEREQIWCWANLGHQFGHNLFNDIIGLQEFLQNKLESNYRKYFLEIFRKAFTDDKFTLKNGAMKIKRSINLDNKTKEVFSDILDNLKLNAALTSEIGDKESSICIQFLKYRWLHWLENCFADIISVLVFDVSAILSAVHKYTFFLIEPADLSNSDHVKSEQELIEWFLGYRSEYPIYFRFLFMTETLKYIEKCLVRQNQFGEKLQNRFASVINVLLDLMNISEQQKNTFRYQYLTIDINLENTMIEYMVQKFFAWISEFLGNEEKDWIAQIAWGDKELLELDNIVFALLHKEKLPSNTNPIQEVVAARFAYELFPRKLEEINNKILQERSDESEYERHTQELICIKYFFKREKYLEWSLFSADVEKLRDQLGPEHEILSDILKDLAKKYKKEISYDQIINQLESTLKENILECNISRKIQMFIDHYHNYKEIRILFAYMEEHLCSIYDNKTYGDKALVTILEEVSFDKILNILLESNPINPGAEEIILDTLFRFANKESCLFADNLFENMKTIERNKEKAIGNVLSYFRLYKHGELFNQKKFSAAMKNWYENFGETRIVHREARKGRIKGKFLVDFYKNYLQRFGENQNYPQNFVAAEQSYKNRIQEFANLTPEPGDYDICQNMDFWLWYNQYRESAIDINASVISNIDKMIVFDLDNHHYEFGDFKNDVKDAIKKMCNEILLWIHFTNVRSVYKQRIEKK